MKWVDMEQVLRNNMKEDIEQDMGDEVDEEMNNRAREAMWRKATEMAKTNVKVRSEITGLAKIARNMRKERKKCLTP